MIYKSLILTVFFSLTIFSNGFTASAQQLNTDDTWLDKPLVNWNGRENNLPSPLEKPADDSVMMKRCSEQIRKPLNAAEKAVEKKGWKLYGASQRYAATEVFLALSSFDGMCRPLGFQAFVYSKGRFAGTLSPVPMNSRTDGSLIDVRLASPTRISVEFARYSMVDPLCCPSRISYLGYNLKGADAPNLTPIDVRTSVICRTDVPLESDSGNEMNSLDGEHWILSKIGEKNINADKPFIEFDRVNMRISGDSGCNRFSGGFTVSGSGLKFSPIISTKRACINADANLLETIFLQILGETTRFEIQGDTLNLYKDDKLTLVFKANSDNAEQNTPSVTGTVRYLQRIALPPGAIIKVQLLDVSKADAEAEIIAEQTINANGKQVPFDFDLRYDPNLINKKNRYVIHAEIFQNGKLQFTSTQAYPVITNGNGNKVKVVVIQVL
jgi:uncharacterized lipoprotein YbaY/heat shock protein HslJ